MFVKNSFMNWCLIGIHHFKCNNEQIKNIVLSFSVNSQNKRCINHSSEQKFFIIKCSKNNN